MYRAALSSFAVAFVLASQASAEFILLQDNTRYPADISLILSPDEEINNGASAFTQTGTQANIDGLNLIVTGYPWTIPASELTDVGPTLNGNPFGAYASFSSQYLSFLGTTGDPFLPTGLVVVLTAGVGEGKTFNEVFGDGYNEAEVMDALVRFRLGDSSGFLLLHDLMASSLDKQPTLTQIGPTTYELGAAQLVRFSTGTLIGDVVAGSLQINQGPQPVPEPSSIVLSLIGIATGIGVARRKRERSQ